MRLAICAIFASGLAGCHDLPDLGTCGNGVIEATNGEACDGDLAGADTCTDTCLLSCQTTAVASDYVQVGVDPTVLGANNMPTPQFCPKGMQCGLDSICRAPSGAFGAPSSAQPFDVKGATVGDVDGDRVDDVIGSSATGLVVRFGSQTGTPFDNGFDQDAPSSEAPVAFFDRDPTKPGVGIPDLSIAVPTDGLGFLTSQGQSFAPDLDVSAPVASDAKHFVITDPTGIGDVIMAAARQGTATAPVTVERVGIPQLLTQQNLAPCGPNNGKLIDVAVARDLREFVVAVRGAANWITCHYRQDTNTGTWLAPVVTLFTTPPPDTLALADITGDACKELVAARVVSPTQSIVGFAHAAQPAGCNFDPNVVTFPPFAIPQAILDAGNIVPSAATDPERDEIVMTSGVYRVNGAALELVAAPTSNVRPWTSAALVDLNGDGILDVVAGRATQDDVDVVRGGATPNVYRADTGFPVSSVVAGDFDGDRLGDAAIVEHGVAGGDRLSILYGRADGFVGPAVPNSGIGGSLAIARLGRWSWAPSVRGTDGIDDLVVLRTDGTGATATAKAGILLGDAPRVLLMPRFPPIPPGPFPTIGAIAAGTFPTPMGPRVQIAAIRSPGPGASQLLVHDFLDGTWTGPTNITGYEVDPTSSPAQLHGAMPQIVSRGAADPMMMQNPKTTLGITGFDGKTCTIVETGRINVFRGADVVGDDGVDELVYTVEDAMDATNRQVHVRDVVPGATGTCGGGEHLAMALAGCGDVVRTGGHTIALCQQAKRWGLYRIDDAKGTREPHPFVEIEGIGVAIVVGDYDGDGVPDLAVGVARAALGVEFVKQCPAHDVRGCN